MFSPARAFGVATFAISSSLAAFVALAPAVGCGSSDDTPDTGPLTGVGATYDAALGNVDSGADGDGSTDGSDAATARVRFVHLAAELGGVDFCWRTSAADSFHGPLLQTGSQGTAFDGGAANVTDAGAGDDADSDADVLLDASTSNDAGDAASDASAADAGNAETMDDSGAIVPPAVDAGPPPLTYLAISDDLTLATAGTIDVIAVEPGSGCSAPLALSTVSLDATLRTTLVLAGGSEADAAGDLAVSAYPDEIASSDATRGAVRVVNAALSPFVGPLSLSFEAAGVDVPLATNVQPRAVAAPSSTSPAVDALGYTLVAALSAAPTFRLVAASTGTSDTTAAIPAAPAAGSVHTAFVTEDATSFVVLWSDDLLSPSITPVR